MSNYERIKTKIEASSISPEDKKLLTDIFAEVSDDSLVDIADLFDKSPSWVEKFNDNRKAKQKALTSNNPSLWSEILEQEKKYLKDLTFGLD